MTILLQKIQENWESSQKHIIFSYLNFLEFQLFDILGPIRPHICCIIFQELSPNNPEAQSDFWCLSWNNLQATASAADLSSPRCLDDKMLEHFADAIVAFGMRDSNFACLDAWIFEDDALKTFARFQAGFLSSEDFHCTS